MRDADRPWIEVEPVIASPLTYDGKVVQIRFTFILSDIGRSPAQNVSIDARLAPAIFVDDLSEDGKRRCEAAAIPGRAGLLKYVMFQGRQYSQPWGINIPVKDLDARFGKMPDGLAVIDPIPVALVGCVDYTYESSNHHHQTVFAYDLNMKSGGLPLKSKTPIPPSDLVLSPHPVSGHYPN